MQVKHGLNIRAEQVEGVDGVTVRWLWSKPDGAPTFALRLFEVEPGASTPYHSHAHEHAVYILSGQALLLGKSQEHRLDPGDTALVLPYDEHQFRNKGPKPLRFLCGVPLPRERMGLTAQVSIYLLRQPELTPTIDDAFKIFHKHDLDVAPGPMSTMISGDCANVFRALQRAFERAAEDSEVVMVSTFSNACPATSKSEPEALSLRTIGYVENEFDEPMDPDTLKASVSCINIDANLTDGLTGLNPGDKVMVVFSFHRSVGYDLLQHPRGDQSQPMRGVFALRSPYRPNPIGITEVELVEVDNNVLTVRGLDAIDGTPVLDLKPV